MKGTEHMHEQGAAPSQPQAGSGPAAAALIPGVAARCLCLLTGL